MKHWIGNILLLLLVLATVFVIVYPFYIMGSWAHERGACVRREPFNVSAGEELFEIKGTYCAEWEGDKK